MRWHKHPVFDYYFSEAGNVRGRKPYKNDHGYLKLDVYLQGVRLKYFMHRLVWETFKGPIPVGLEVDHIDGKRRNNRVNNLRLLTRKQNLDRRKYV